MKPLIIGLVLIEIIIFIIFYETSKNKEHQEHSELKMQIFEIEKKITVYSSDGVINLFPGDLIKGFVNTPYDVKCYKK